MKLKAKAVMVVVLFSTGILILHQLQSDETGENIVAFHMDETKHVHLKSKYSNMRQIPLRRSNGSRCLPTRLATCYSDLTSYFLSDNLSFNVTNSGAYAVQLSRQEKQKLEDKKAKNKNLQKLNVYVIPHSQNPHGRLLNVHKFYDEKSMRILNTTIEKLTQYPAMRFIWADTSLLSDWWNQQSPAYRQKLLTLIHNKQLEIVNGGWVVTDEACTQYHNVIQQLIEGHQWLYNTLGVKPRINWAVEPFGHSETMPYLWKLAGFNHMVVGRVHAAIKTYLGLQQKLEFKWRQFWDPESHTDIHCHVLPYASANTVDTCGPDKSVCSTFDFAESPQIPNYLRDNDADFVVLASTLYEQYQRTAKDFPHNTIFVPLGGDYRWGSPEEWDKHYLSYSKIFEYMNKRKDWRVSVKFGTLNDYFRKVAGSVSETSQTPIDSPLPVFSGNFLPYSDQSNEYWTGYFSSRAWLKFLGREVESALRTVNLLHTLACSRVPYDAGIMKRCHEHGVSLDASRKELSLFQHYRAISGTSKSGVVYEQVGRILSAFRSVNNVARWAIPTILLDDLLNFQYVQPTVKQLHGLAVRKLPEAFINISEEHNYKVVLFNPLPVQRVETVSLRVNDSNVIVSIDEKPIPSQVVPVVGLNRVINASVFDISFSVTIPPLGMETVWIRPAESEPNRAKLSRVSIARIPKSCELPCPFPVEGLSTFREIVLENDCLTLEFEGKTGLLKEVFDKTTGSRTTVDIDFLSYTPYKSGAHVFQSRMEARTCINGNDVNVLVSRGPQVSSVQIIHPLFRHVVKVHHMPSGLHCRAIHIENLVQLGNTTDIELIMRIKTDILNRGDIYTDGNGFQMVKRPRRSKLPLGANIHPMTNMAFIQSQARRLTLHSFQSLAVSSLQDGVIDVLLERAVTNNEMRGTDEGLWAGYPTPSKFYISLEETEGRPSDQKPYSLPSLFSYHLNDMLQNPVFATHYQNNRAPLYKSRRWGVQNPLPCDFHIVSLRELSLYRNDVFNAAMIVNRRGYACGAPLDTLYCSREWNGFKFDSLLTEFRMNSVSEWKLSYLDKLGNVALNKTIEMNPMDIKAFHFRFK